MRFGKSITIKIYNPELRRQKRLSKSLQLPCTKCVTESMNRFIQLTIRVNWFVLFQYENRFLFYGKRSSMNTQNKLFLSSMFDMFHGEYFHVKARDGSGDIHKKRGKRVSHRISSHTNAYQFRNIKENMIGVDFGKIFEFIDRLL